MTKLEKRFGNKPQPDTAQDQLSNSRQLQDEKIEDWADRVQQLAARAYPNLPEDHMTKQAIKRICHGCLDKEAGQHVVHLNLPSVELVVDKIKSYQYNHKSIYTGYHHSKKDVREISLSPMNDSDSSDYDDEPKVRQTRFTRSSGRTQDQGRSRDLDSSKSKIDTLTKEVNDLKGDIKSLVKHLETLRSRSPVPSNIQTRSRSPSPVQCFKCQGQGHYARDCPSKSDRNRPAKQVSFSPTINEKGLGKKA